MGKTSAAAVPVDRKATTTEGSVNIDAVDGVIDLNGPQCEVLLAAAGEVNCVEVFSEAQRDASVLAKIKKENKEINRADEAEQLLTSSEGQLSGKQ